MTEYKKDYFEDRKLKYEKNHGVFIHEFMFTEFTNRILGQCNVALNDLQRQLDVEIARAKAEELRIENKAHNELEKVYQATRFVAEPILDGVLNTEVDLSKLFKYLYSDGNGHLRLSDEQEHLLNSYNATLEALMDTNNNNADTLNRYLEEREQNNLNNFNKLLRIANVTTTENINQAQNEKTIYPCASWDPDTNELEITTPNKAEKSLPQSLIAGYNALAQAHNTINNLYMVNNTDSYKLNDQMRLIKNDQQTKLISNYNDSLMNIARAFNMHTQAIKDLRTDLKKLQSNKESHIE